MGYNNDNRIQRESVNMVLKRFTAAINKEGKWYVARCLEVEVTSQGETLEKSLANLKEALELYFEDDTEASATESPIIAPVEVNIAL